jgi:hypothetical protein
MALNGVLSFISWSIKPQDSISLNNLIVKGFVVSVFDSATNILNLVICSSIDSFFFILRACNLSSASPTESNMENAFISSFLNIIYASSLSFGLAGAGQVFASSINCAFHVAAAPAFIDDKTKAIFLRLVL